MEHNCTAGTWTWHESTWCYMDMVEHAKQNENTCCYMASWKHCVLGHGHGMKTLGATWTWLNMQNKNENTWCYMASWKHCVLEIRQCIFLDLQLWPWWPIDHQTWCPCHTGRYSTSAAGTAGLYHWTCFWPAGCVGMLPGASPSHGGQPDAPICSCSPAAFWVLWLWQLWPGHLQLWHGHWQLGPATECGNGKNVNKWQCRQLCIPPASSTGATPVRLVPSVANMHSQKMLQPLGL